MLLGGDGGVVLLLLLLSLLYGEERGLCDKEGNICRRRTAKERDKQQRKWTEKKIATIKKYEEELRRIKEAAGEIKGLAISQIILVQFSTRLVVGDADPPSVYYRYWALTQLSGKYQNRSVTSGPIADRQSGGGICRV